MTESKGRIEIIVGLFMFLGLICVSYLAIRLGNLDVGDDGRYEVHAKFTSASASSSISRWRSPNSLRWSGRLSRKPSRRG